MSPDYFIGTAVKFLYNLIHSVGSNHGFNWNRMPCNPLLKRNGDGPQTPITTHLTSTSLTRCWQSTRHIHGIASGHNESNLFVLLTRPSFLAMSVKHTSLSLTSGGPYLCLSLWQTTAQAFLRMDSQKIRWVQESRLTQARDGDDLMQNIYFLEAMWSQSGSCNEKDVLAFQCIRRINLDTFWSQARSTVASKKAAKIKDGLRIPNSLGLDGPSLDPCPLPIHNHCGIQEAIQSVVLSLDSGCYPDTLKHWDTVRRFRSCFSNQFSLPRKANLTLLVLVDGNGSAGFHQIAIDLCG